MRSLAVTTLALLLSCGAAFGQIPVPDPLKPDTGARAPKSEPATGPSPATQTSPPTAAQCAAGYQVGMSWTRDEFLKACSQNKETGK